MQSSFELVASAVATLTIKKRQLLLGRRIENNIFAGWQCPGGFLNKGESVKTAAQRICLEKAGITINNYYPGPYTNNLFSDGTHTTTLYVIANFLDIQNSAAFNHQQTGWQWFDFKKLPTPLFLPLQNLIDQIDLGSL